MKTNVCLLIVRKEVSDHRLLPSPNEIKLNKLTLPTTQSTKLTNIISDTIYWLGIKHQSEKVDKKSNRTK